MIVVFTIAGGCDIGWAGGLMFEQQKTNVVYRFPVHRFLCLRLTTVTKVMLCSVAILAQELCRKVTKSEIGASCVFNRKVTKGALELEHSFKWHVQSD
jgi:hypothetical protein